MPGRCGAVPQGTGKPRQHTPHGKNLCLRPFGASHVPLTPAGPFRGDHRYSAHTNEVRSPNSHVIQPQTSPPPAISTHRRRGCVSRLIRGRCAEPVTSMHNHPAQEMPQAGGRMSHGVGTGPTRQGLLRPRGAQGSTRLGVMEERRKLWRVSQPTSSAVPQLSRAPQAPWMLVSCSRWRQWDALGCLGMRGQE